jgi:hypothetical protein
MKKYFLTLLFVMSLLPISITYPCSCGGWESFLKGYKYGDIVCVIKVESYETYLDENMPLSMEAAVLNVIKGTETREKITIWGDRGWDCAPYLVHFPIGSTWVTAISQINDTTYYNSPGLNIGDYFIGGCYESYLSVVDSIVSGYIFEENITTSIPVQSIALDSLITIIQGPTNISDPPGTHINEFGLFQNYPNPFNPMTHIRYTLPTKQVDYQVSVKVYDVLGRSIADLFNGSQSPGVYILDFDGSALAGGIYYYTVRADQFISTKKMILLK